MSKGMDQKKEQKKKPAKTGKEKKAEKRDKKTAKGFAPVLTGLSAAGSAQLPALLRDTRVPA